VSSRQSQFDRELPRGPIVAYRLDGTYDFHGARSTPQKLRGAGIVASGVLTAEQGVRLRSILGAVETYGGEGARCFFPGIGFTMGEGPGRTEFLLCLRCYWSYAFRGETQMVDALSDIGHRQLLEFYIELFPAGDPAAA
jgi:hypothetical protein